FAVLDLPPAVARPPRGTARPAPDPGREPVRLRRARFSRPGRGEALRGVDLELAPGETVALVGPSGAGKTTLLTLLLRLAAPDEGEVLCGGVDLREVEPEEWWRRVAWVPQRPTLFAGTVEENVRLAAPEASDARVM